MTNLLTNSEFTALQGRVDQWIDGQDDAAQAKHDASMMLAEIIEMRRRLTGAVLALDGRAHSVTTTVIPAEASLDE